MADLYPPGITKISELYELYSKYSSMAEFAAQYRLPIETQYELLRYQMFNQQVEAFAYYNGYTAALGGQAVFQQASSSAVTVASGSASQALTIYEAAGGALTEAGAATSEALPTYTSETAIVATGAGTFTLGGLLAAAPAVVACGIAAIAGYDMGTDLYNNNPEFAEEVFQALLPWTFDLIDRLVGLVDWNGKTYLDKRCYDALREKIASIPPKYKTEVPSGFPDVYRTWQELGGAFSDGGTTLRTYDHSLYWDRWSEYTNFQTEAKVAYVQATGPRTYDTNYLTWVYPNAAFSTRSLLFYSDKLFTIEYDKRTHTGAGKNPSSTSRTEQIFRTMAEEYQHYTVTASSWTYAGKTVYYYGFSAGNSNSSGCYYVSPYPDAGIPSSTILGPGGSHNYPSDYGFAWLLQFGTTIGTIIDGVTQWLGDKVDDPYADAIDVVVDTNGNTVPYIPIALPSSTATHLDPISNPNPQQYTQPSTQVQPYYNPYAFPNYYHTPKADVGVDPNTNPSTEGKTDTQPNLPPPPPPSDTGDSPPNLPNATPPVFDLDSSALGGLINVYNPTPAELYSFARWLWVTYSDVTVPKIFNNPFDGVISLHELYATPITGDSRTIRSGFLDSGVSSIVVPNRYSYINCGNIVVPEYWGNYLDYSPYTKAFAYLPFIGIVELEADDIIGRAVNITYGVDSYSGACTAMITVAKQNMEALTYQYNGNCAVSHPISGGTQASVFLALTQLAGQTITGFMGGGGLAGALAGFGGGVFSAANAKSTVQHSGSFGSNYGAMSPKKPYLIIKRPVQAVVPNYNEIYGYQAHKFVRIGNCTGYIKCREVHVNSATATDEEKSRIEELLKSGVYVS